MRRSGQIERAQDAAFGTLSEIASSLDATDDLPAFFAGLAETVARRVGAARAAFWRVGTRGSLKLQPHPFGFAADSAVRGARFALDSKRPGILERVVYDNELELVQGTSPDLDRMWHERGLTEITNSIAVAWRAGERRIGMLAAYDARDGFTARELWLLRLAGTAAGLVWQCREAEEDLDQTAMRLEEAMTARRHLLNNIAAGGDEARRRFASALHDDSLQLLTGAELQLERVRGELDGLPQVAQLDQLNQTLHKVEDSLRRLLMNVSPEPLALPGDLGSAISERVEELRVRSGIEGHVELRLPTDIPSAIQAIVIKNISEALTNVVKHARATRVTVVADEIDGGIRIQVTDDGTGFVVGESVRMPGHIGLVALRERAQLAGGTCRIESEPGAGTTVEFWLPMSL